jgi:hypothetical protein
MQRASLPRPGCPTEGQLSLLLPSRLLFLATQHPSRSALCRLTFREPVCGREVAQQAQAQAFL